MGLCKGLKREWPGQSWTGKMWVCKEHELSKGGLDQTKDHDGRLKWAGFILQGIAEDNALCVLQRQIWL